MNTKFKAMSFSGPRNNVALAGLDDLHGAWQRRHVAAYFALTDTFARYRRSTIGPLWIVLGTAVGVVGLGLVWSVLLGIPKAHFIPMLTVGLIGWQFISGTILEASSVFARNASTITNLYVPRFSFTIELVLRQLITLGHNLLVILLVWIVFPENWSWVILLALPGLLIVSASLLAVAQIVGFVGARYRDVELFFVAIMPILFFLTPILYETRQLGHLESIMLFNPLAHWILLLRDPMMGQVPSLLNYSVALSTCVVLWVIALVTTGAKAKRLPYWL